jgi:hypothetical protein
MRPVGSQDTQDGNHFSLPQIRGDCTAHRVIPGGGAIADRHVVDYHVGALPPDLLARFA